MPDNELYNRQRMHDMVTKISEVSMVSDMNNDRIDKIENSLKEHATKYMIEDIKEDVAAIKAEVKQMLQCSQGLLLRINQMEAQLKSYNRFMWLLLSTTATAVAAWYLK